MEQSHSSQGAASPFGLAVTQPAVTSVYSAVSMT